jgi:hypothetical protein
VPFQDAGEGAGADEVLAALLLMDEVAGRNAPGGVEEGAGYLSGEGGEIGQGGPVFPLNDG